MAWRREVRELERGGAAAKPARASWTMDQKPERNTPTQHRVSRTLFERQPGLLPGSACNEFVQGMRNLPMGADQIPDFRRLSSVLMQRTGWQMVRTQPAVGNFQVTGRVPNSVECCWPFRASTLPEHMATIWTGTQGRRGAPLMLTCLGPGP